MKEPGESRIFVGIGNPGQKYARTRHNLGFLVIEKLADELGWAFKEKKALCTHVAKGEGPRGKVYLLMPTTYVNGSGYAVSAFLQHMKLTPQDLLVICDDTALPFGSFRLRAQGSAGGHNGLKSIADHLHTQAYARLRMGIGRGDKQIPLADYVLSEFDEEEQALLPSVIAKGTAILKEIMDKAINAQPIFIKENMKPLGKGVGESKHESKTEPL